MTAMLWLLPGLAAGTAHFALLRRNVRLYVAGGGALRALGAHALRVALTGLTLLFAAWHGALPLLLCAAGVMLGRPLVLRMTASPP